MATKVKEKESVQPLAYYEQLRQVPAGAIRAIASGRLKGKSDINPMWRIKAMTQVFGPCGIGWRYEIVKQWSETYGQEVKCYTNIHLYIKVDGAWSEPIPGTGGATLVEVNQRGSYVNDEGYKMSLTDALSVAMKALGVAADVYFAADASYGTKYEAGCAQPRSVAGVAAVPPHTGQPMAGQAMAGQPMGTQMPMAQPTQGAQPMQAQPQTTGAQPAQPQTRPTQPVTAYTQAVADEIQQANTKDALMGIYAKYTGLQKTTAFLNALTKRKKELTA